MSSPGYLCSFLDFMLNKDGAEHARGKLANKRLDMIVANDVSKLGTGFGTDQNHVILFSHEQKLDSGQQHKAKIANFILTHIAEQLPS